MKAKSNASKEKEMTGIGVSAVSARSNQRLHWLDYSKTIGMFLVVWGHTFKDNSQIVKDVIYSFHMPLFFFISGFLHKSGQIGGG